MKSQGGEDRDNALTSFSGKDLHQEVGDPSGPASFHDLALLARRLFDEAQGEASQPSEFFCEGANADAACSFAAGGDELPVKRVFNPPEATDSGGESLAFRRCEPVPSLRFPTKRGQVSMVNIGPSQGLPL